MAKEFSDYLNFGKDEEDYPREEDFSKEDEFKPSIPNEEPTKRECDLYEQMMTLNNASYLMNNPHIVEESPYGTMDDLKDIYTGLIENYRVKGNPSNEVRMEKERRQFYESMHPGNGDLVRRLEYHLEEAVEKENFEEAAKLRDQLKDLIQNEF